MEANPYTFDEKNSRVVTNANRSDKLLPAFAMIYLGSMWWYNKQRFRIDQNALNLAGFTIGAVPASWVFAQQAVGCMNVEAGRLNNQRESGESTSAVSFFLPL